MSEPDKPPQAVSAKDILGAIHVCQRLGHRRVIEDLEQREPDHTEHLLESLGQVHRSLLNAGLSPRETRKLYRLVETFALVSIRALEAAHLD